MVHPLAILTSSDYWESTILNSIPSTRDRVDEAEDSKGSLRYFKQHGNKFYYIDDLAHFISVEVHSANLAMSPPTLVVIADGEDNTHIPQHNVAETIDGWHLVVDRCCGIVIDHIFNGLVRCVEVVER